jgi:hypothetical protein
MGQQQGPLDAPYMHMLDDTDVCPIFVMGDHRTGTTILYTLLGATGCFNTLTVYHVLNRHELLHNHAKNITAQRKDDLAEVFRSKGLSNRVLDGIRAGPDMPEEYGYALQVKGPRLWLRPENLHEFTTLGKKVQHISDQTKPLLLKNPWDFFLNFMYVKQAFPRSKFIFIHRNPIRTINSQLSATRSMYNAKNEYIAMVLEPYRRTFERPALLRVVRFLFSSHFDLGYRLVSRHVARAVDYYLRNIGAFPAQDYVSVRYEDLCAQPERTITTILDTLGMKPNTALPYDSLIQVRNGSLLPEVARHQGVIRRRMQPYFDHFGYTLEDA